MKNCLTYARTRAGAEEEIYYYILIYSGLVWSVICGVICGVVCGVIWSVICGVVVLYNAYSQCVTAGFCGVILWCHFVVSFVSVFVSVFVVSFCCGT